MAENETNAEVQAENKANTSSPSREELGLGMLETFLATVEETSLKEDPEFFKKIKDEDLQEIINAVSLIAKDSSNSEKLGIDSFIWDSCAEVRNMIKENDYSFIKAFEKMDEKDRLFIQSASFFKGVISDSLFGIIQGRNDKPLYIEDEFKHLKAVVYFSYMAKGRGFTKRDGVNLNVSYALNGEVRNRVFYIPAGYSLTEGFKLIPADAFPEGEIRKIIRKEQEKYPEVESLEGDIKLDMKLPDIDNIKSILKVITGQAPFDSFSVINILTDNAVGLKKLSRFRDLDEAKQILPQEISEAVVFLQYCLRTIDHFWTLILGPGWDCPYVFTEDNKPTMRAFIYGPRVFGVPLDSETEFGKTFSSNLVILSVSKDGDWLEKEEKNGIVPSHIIDVLNLNFKNVGSLSNMYNCDDDHEDFMMEDEYSEPSHPSLEEWENFIKEGKVPFGDDERYKLHRTLTVKSAKTGKDVDVDDDIYYDPDDWVYPWLS